MEETRRIGIVGRWVTHWSFWPAYAAVVALLLLVVQPWTGWSEWIRTKPPHSVRVYDASEEAPWSDSERCSVGTIVLTAATLRPPADWLACDGGGVARSEYPELADWLDAETDTVVVPDFSRLFGFRNMRDGACETLALQPARITEHFEEPTRLCFWIKAR